MAVEPSKATREQPELIEAELIEPSPERSPANGAIDAVLDATGRVLEPVARLGWRVTSRVGRGLGLDRIANRAVDRALNSEAADQVVERALESESVKRAWDRVLESEEAQKLVERVAEAPEVRSAITSQGVGLLEDLRRSARRAARRLDDAAERVVRGALRRPRRAQRPPYAGAATRGLAITLDGAIVSGILLLISTLVALLLNAVFSLEGDSKVVTIAFGAAAWWVAAGLYLAVFWSLAERTPGMTFFGLRILSEEGGRVPPRQDLRRLVGFVASLIPFGLGFLGILTDERRRGWHDRHAHTLVYYADPEVDPGVDKAGNPIRG
jgi:uncharacterized RDD family membrane protein YckC